MGLKLKNDVIFKAVFGREAEDSKQALMGMLNLLLDRKDDPIRRITYKNPFNVREIDIQKESVLDIKAETDRMELVDIEMQLLYDNEFMPRNLYYHGGMITQGLAAGEPYGKLKKTISIYILDHIWFKDDDSYHKCFQLREKDSGELLSELLEMHYIELPKVNPGHVRLPENLSEAERFLEFLRCAGEEKNDSYLKSLKRCGGKEIQMAEVIMQEVTEEERLREQAIARDKFLHMKASIERQLKEAEEVLAQRDEFERQKEDFQRQREELQRQREDFQRQHEEQQRQSEEFQRQHEEQQRQSEEFQRQIEEYEQQIEEYGQQIQQMKGIVQAMISNGIDRSEVIRAVQLTEEELNRLIK